MKRIKIGDLVQSDYGSGKVLAVTKQWFIHDNSSEGGHDEFAILLAEDDYQVVTEPALHQE